MNLPNFGHVRVLCIGDIMLDRFVQGRVRRISPESPVPIIEMDEVENVPGGAANVGRNICALGGGCTLIGAIGRDQAGDELKALLTCDGMIPVLTLDDTRPTIEKVRYVAFGQHLLRADREIPGDISDDTAAEIIRQVTEQIADHHVLILSDYAKGVLTDAVISTIIGIASQAGVPVVVDPKSIRLERYAGASVITPNAKETSSATGIDIVGDADAERAGAKVLADTKIAALLMTRSEQGMTLMTRDGEVVHVPASGREVYDVVGAGDTVVATLALCMGAGMPMEASVHIANAAAGVVVGKRGTATLTRSELLDELSRLSRLGMSSSKAKVMSASSAFDLRTQWDADGLSVGFTNGCFDILHIGHIRILEFARSQCDRLIVGVNSDASVKRLKGPTRPVNEEADRAHILGAFGFVDAVVIFDEDTPYDLIAQLQPDVLVKGADYKIEEVVGCDIVQKRGGKVVTFELVPDRSTTGIIAKAAATSKDTA
ncbi:D-glycero-beta-D-manno-heptose-7-phosphate kinase [Novosphingobium sp. BL-8A]|uniref:D-glycero-beta-D-manno-heptose-7-phosphate kinase n=1 Tax=Novosphingobium sp. BL-8A TaxID=3127639 RepID=UPI003756F7DD